MESSKTQKQIVTCNLILVENPVKGKEGPFVHIYVLNYVIAENVFHAIVKEKLLNVIVERLKEWQNVVNKGLYFNVANDAKKS